MFWRGISIMIALHTLIKINKIKKFAEKETKKAYI